MSIRISAAKARDDDRKVRVFGRIWRATKADPERAKWPYWFQTGPFGEASWTGCSSFGDALGSYLFVWSEQIGHRRAPRWLQRIAAWWGGYFWMNCYRCGKGFGGQQWHGEAMTYAVTAETGRCQFCPDCARTRDVWDRGWRERAEGLWLDARA